MNWEAIGAIGEVLGAAGVIISLLYLAVQIRGDARAKRAATVHEQSEAYRDFLQLVATDHDLADVYLRGIRDFGSIKDAELPRFSALLGFFFRVYEEGYFQRTEGLLDPHVWHGMESTVHDLLAYPGVRQWWDTRAHWYSKPFRDFIEEKLKTIGAQRLYREPAAEQGAAADVAQRVPIDLGSFLALNLGASATVGGLCHAAERPLR